MFFKLCSPASTKLAAILPCTWRQASSEMRDAAGLGDALDPRRDVDAVAEDVVALDDDVADIDPDPKPDRIGLPPVSRSRNCL